MTTVEQTSDVVTSDLSTSESRIGRLRWEADTRVVWWLLGIWFVANLAACGVYAYWIQPLGFGAIVYLLFGGPVVVAQFGFAAVWMWLGDDTRLARIADLPMGMCLLAIAFSQAMGNGMAVCWPLLLLIIVTSLPLVPFWKRGLRITRRQMERGKTAVWWRFGLGDLLIGTTCLAVMMGIVLTGRQPFEESQWLLVLAAPAWLVTLLALRGKIAFWTLWTICAAIGLAIGLVLTERVPDWMSFDVRVFTVLSGTELLSLAITGSILRKLGYRMRFIAGDCRQPGA